MEFRTSTKSDAAAIVQLYQTVALAGGGIARNAKEITLTYVEGFLEKAGTKGIGIVGITPENSTEIVAEIHASRLEPDVFSHVLSDLTLVIHPAFQGRKIGRTIFTIFLEEIALHHPEIGRVELVVRESNSRAIALYQSLGFLIEGRMEMRLKNESGHYEADIPMAWQNPNFEF